MLSLLYRSVVVVNLVPQEAQVVTLATLQHPQSLLVEEAVAGSRQVTLKVLVVLAETRLGSMAPWRVALLEVLVAVRVAVALAELLTTPWVALAEEGAGQSLTELERLALAALAAAMALVVEAEVLLLMVLTQEQAATAH